MYDWYSSITGGKGVYIVQTEYYDTGIIETWQNNKTYFSMPNAPLWLFTMSPNYLESPGVTIPAGALLSAQSGTRLYLLPAAMPDEEKTGSPNGPRNGIPEVCVTAISRPPLHKIHVATPQNIS